MRSRVAGLGWSQQAPLARVEEPTWQLALAREPPRCDRVESASRSHPNEAAPEAHARNRRGGRAANGVADQLTRVRESRGSAPP